MATLFRNSNSPIWRARYFNADGKRISKSTGTKFKREAKRIAEGYENEARRKREKADQLPKAYAVLLETVAREAAAGSLTLVKAEEFVHRLHRIANPDFKIVSLADFWTGWIDDQEPHIVISTASGYRNDFAIFSSALGGKIMAKPVGAVTADEITRALAKAAEGGRKASTVNKALACFRRVLDAAVAKKLATHNPARQVRPLRMTDSIDRGPFSIAEVRAMLDHPDTSDEWRGAITFGVHTGLRLSDILSLNRKHIDGTRLVIMPGKTARRKKVIAVPLSPPCLGWIGCRTGDFFPTLKARSIPACSSQFRAIMKRAGVPAVTERPGGIKERRSFHSTRHTFISLLAEADVHADVRQKLAGHSNSGIHARYTHHDEALERAVGMLPDI